MFPIIILIFSSSSSSWMIFFYSLLQWIWIRCSGFFFPKFLPPILVIINKLNTKVFEQRRVSQGRLIMAITNDVREFLNLFDSLRIFSSNENSINYWKTSQLIESVYSYLQMYFFSSILFQVHYSVWKIYSKFIVLIKFRIELHLLSNIFLFNWQIIPTSKLFDRVSEKFALKNPSLFPVISITETWL